MPRAELRSALLHSVQLALVHVTSLKLFEESVFAIFVLRVVVNYYSRVSH